MTVLSQENMMLKRDARHGAEYATVAEPGTSSYQELELSRR